MVHAACAVVRACLIAATVHAKKLLSMLSQGRVDLAASWGPAWPSFCGYLATLPQPLNLASWDQVGTGLMPRQFLSPDAMCQ